MSVLRQLMQKEQNFPKWEQTKHFLCWCNTELTVATAGWWWCRRRSRRPSRSWTGRGCSTTRRRARPSGRPPGQRRRTSKPKVGLLYIKAVTCKFWPNKTNKCKMVQKEKNKVISGFSKSYKKINFHFPRWAFSHNYWLVTLSHFVSNTDLRISLSGKKKDMMSMFQSKTALEKQADKLSAKQEELNIKSTGEGLKLFSLKI